MLPGNRIPIRPRVFNRLPPYFQQYTIPVERESLLRLLQQHFERMKQCMGHQEPLVAKVSKETPFERAKRLAAESNGRK